MCLFRFVAALGTSLLWLSLALAQGAGESRETPPLDKEKLAERNQLLKQSQTAREQGRINEAIVAVQKALTLERELFGEKHQEVLLSLRSLAELHEACEDFGAARTARAEVLEMSTHLFGPDKWQTTDARWALRQTLELQRLSPEDRRRLATATAQVAQVLRLEAQGQYRESQAPIQQALQTRLKILGERHPQTAACMNHVAWLSYQLGDYAHAESLFLRSLEIFQDVTGNEHPSVSKTLNSLGAVYKSRGDNAKAELMYLRSLEITEKAFGKEHPSIATCLNNLAMLYHDQGDDDKAARLVFTSLKMTEKTQGSDHPSMATCLNNLAKICESRGDYAHAEALYERSLTIVERALGKDHPTTAVCLNNLAMLYRTQSDFAKAEPLCLRGLAIRERVVGTHHPDTAVSLNSLAALYHAMGDFEKAETLYLRSLEISEKMLGPDHGDVAKPLSNLALLYVDQGDFANAEPLCLRSHAILEKARGKEHPETATSLNNLAGLYHHMGDYRKAEPLYTHALEINERTLGREHPATANSLSNLAVLCHRLGDDARAESLYLRSLEITEKTLGKQHMSTAIRLNNLALLYCAQEKYAQAEPLYQRSRDIMQRALGKDHPSTGISLNNLGGLYDAMGDHKRAQPLYERSLEIREKALGTDHPSTAITLANLAALYKSLRSYAKAEPLYRRASTIMIRHLEATAVIQSEWQQLEMMRDQKSYLDGFLDMCADEAGFEASAYEQLLAWKGATLVRQRAMRLAAAAPDIAEQFRRLQQLTRYWISLARAVPAKEDDLPKWRERVAQLAGDKERLEAEISRGSATFRDAQRRVTLDNVRAALGKDTVLVDFLEFTHFPPPATKGRLERGIPHLLACVVRPTGAPRLHDLGPVARIDEAVDNWRRAVGSLAEGNDAGHCLRRLIWEPVLPDVRDAVTILVSPDGVLGRIPLNALPGEKAGTYLVDDHRLALWPVPRLLPEVLQEPSRNEQGRCLLVGDVDYDASPGEETPEAKDLTAPNRHNTALVRPQGFRFPSLPGTTGEVKAIQALNASTGTAATDLVLLNGGKATKERFRQLAPDCRSIHLATHGFFAGADQRSALASDSRSGDRFRLLSAEPEKAWAQGFRPGLLSGLALAGANRAPVPDREDGILTAEEIAFLPLRSTDLATLSACETGLGAVAGGEGLLGLQRAFQVAGVRTTVASLWKVDDAATEAFMTEFYTNLWKHHQSKLDAFRNAQMKMLRAYDPQAKRILSRGATSPDEEATAPKPTSPRYWAAFVLSGDWR